MAEFKKLSEVELLETSSDSATVLVEESGEIKRVPKKEVGGGAGGYVVTLTLDNQIVEDYIHKCFDNYDPIYDTLMAGGPVWIDQSNIVGWFSRTLAVSCSLAPMGLVLTDSQNSDLIFPNGSHHSTEK